MRTVTATELRAKLGEILDAASAGERILIERDHKPLAFLISPEEEAARDATERGAADRAPARCALDELVELREAHEGPASRPGRRTHYVEMASHVLRGAHGQDHPGCGRPPRRTDYGTRAMNDASSSDCIGDDRDPPLRAGSRRRVRDPSSRNASGPDLVAPAGFWLEIVNSLVRRHRWYVGPDVLQGLQTLDTVRHPRRGPQTGRSLLLTLDLAERFGLTAYDACTWPSTISSRAKPRHPGCGISRPLRATGRC